MATGLLAQLELEGRVVTGDALYCQRDLSLRVLEQGGDYFWTLKDNQPGMREAVSLLFAEPPWGERFAEAVREGWCGDRWERRRLWASTALNEYLDWPGPGLLRRANQMAPEQRDSGAFLGHHQPAALPAQPAATPHLSGGLGLMFVWQHRADSDQAATQGNGPTTRVVREVWRNRHAIVRRLRN
ncbi:MAG: hypothetical protein F4X66_04520 [Chloroflexi bacterium]|nr:hypothetical protein [Chloroflexota bacterium]MYE41973.1 hypothetical protein [Chloroflexota bacterium]